VSTPLAAQRSLLADLARWLAKARRAGFDDDGIAALFESAVRDDAARGVA